MRARATLIGSLAILLSLSGTAPSAQEIPRQSLEDKVLGWIKIYDYKGATQPLKVDQRVYSPAQLSIARLFANWMQASYLPTGALGDVILIRNKMSGRFIQNAAALPQSYGAWAKLYFELKYDANKKLTPWTNSHYDWTIEANGFYGTPAEALSTPEHFYFTLPTFAQTMADHGPGAAELQNAADASRHPVLG